MLSARARRGRHRHDRRLYRTSQARSAGCCTRWADRAGRRSGSGCRRSAAHSAHLPVCRWACQGWGTKSRARYSTRRSRGDSSCSFRNSLVSATLSLPNGVKKFNRAATRAKPSRLGIVCTKKVVFQGVHPQVTLLQDAITQNSVGRNSFFRP